MAVLEGIKSAASASAYWVKRWVLKRRLKLLRYRREELLDLVERELKAIEYEEHVTNVALRELQSRKLQSNLVEVAP
mgnify:CR=1 FL=1